MHEFFQHFYVYPKKIIHLLHLFNGLWLVVHCICPYLYLYLYLLSYIFFKKQSVKVWLEKIKKKLKNNISTKHLVSCVKYNKIMLRYIFLLPSKHREQPKFHILSFTCRVSLLLLIFKVFVICKYFKTGKCFKKLENVLKIEKLNKLAFLKILLNRIDLPIF